jgi:hypothetical protein
LLKTKNMKKALSIFVSAIISLTALAQSPQSMSYQAVIRNASNNLVISTVVGMRISILQGSSSGTAVYVETQTPSTNVNGLVSIAIGGGTVTTGTFSAIDWAVGPYFVKTETDPVGGTNYTITGTNQLLSVPYALYAANSPASPVGFGYFYGLTSGTGNASFTDYPATIFSGGAVSFSRNTVTPIGVAINNPGSGQSNNTEFRLSAIGTYRVSWFLHTTEPGQLQLTGSIDGGTTWVVKDETTVANLNPTTGGHPIIGDVLITTTVVNELVKVIVPAGNAFA